MKYLITLYSLITIAYQIKIYENQLVKSRRTLVVDLNLQTQEKSDLVISNYKNGNFTDLNDIVAICELIDALDETGWYILEVITSNEYNDTFQSRAGGVCEGEITYNMTWDAYSNYVNGILKGQDIPIKSQQFLKDQMDWMQYMVDLNSDNPYWQNVDNLLHQLQGLYVGYNATQNFSGDHSRFLDFVHYTYLSNMGDLDDIMPSHNDSIKKDHSCSLFFRLLEDRSNLVCGHTTFNKYYLMLRIYKIYAMNFNNTSVKNKVVQFSSRPGDLQSKDDFFTLDTLVVMETSLLNFKKENFDFVQPESLPSWLRTQLANRMSNSGKEWAENFQKYHSGTHNAQWYIIDYKVFYAGSTENMVWMIEEAYDEYSYSDQTDILLKQGYIAGYNIPKLQAYYDKLGYQDSNWKGQTYDDNYRANLFRQYYKVGSSVSGVQYLMQMNSNLTGLPCGVAPSWEVPTELAVRCDQVNYLFGAIDGKVIDAELMKSGSTYIKSGPTTNGPKPYFNPFSWKDFPNEPHQGHAQVYTSEWIFLNITNEIQLSK